MLSSQFAFPHHSKQVLESTYYYLDLAPSVNTDLCVVCGGLEICDPGYRVERQEFHTHTIEYVLNGRGHVTIAGAQYALSPGTLFNYGPGIPHEIQNDPNTPMTKYFVNFVGETAESLIKAGPLQGGKAIRISQPHEILLLFDRLQQEGERATLQARTICALYVHILLHKAADLAAGTEAGDSKAWEAYMRCKDYIDNNFRSIRSISDVAVNFDLDRSYVSRLFRRFLNTPPHAYLMRRKLIEAAHLLLTTQLNVGDVAEVLAFSDQFHLSRAFKKEYGVPPVRFRSKHWQGKR